MEDVEGVCEETNWLSQSDGMYLWNKEGSPYLRLLVVVNRRACKVVKGSTGIRKHPQQGEYARWETERESGGIVGGGTVVGSWIVSQQQHSSVE